MVANETSAEKAKTQDRKETVAVAASPSAVSRDGISALGGASRSATRREDKSEKDKNDADTRTVAGRQFRKQGGVWIDTDYSSSRRVTDLTRGSEQYRALVGDEPEIKRIADTLDGEILVVWKSRAYRIR